MSAIPSHALPSHAQPRDLALFRIRLTERPARCSPSRRLAALGFPVAEQFHPLFGGNLDVPSYISFQETPLQSFWPVVVLLISTVEVYSVFSFNSPFNGETWSVRSDHEPGNLGWDPLNLKPTDPSAFKEMATKELNNGRLAMIGAAGMIAQELASGDKLFN